LKSHNSTLAVRPDGHLNYAADLHCGLFRNSTTCVDANFLSRGNRFILQKVNCGGIDGAAKKFCGYRWFESVSLQRGVDCEPDFRGQIPSMTVGASPTPAPL